MAKAPVVEESEFRHAVKVAGVTGQAKERDVALLWVAYGTGMMPIELARLAIGDYGGLMWGVGRLERRHATVAAP